MLTIEPYEYQNAAIDMALDRGNLLIAYGMGLGKTLITMGICEELLGEGSVTMNCIVVPASLKWQWAQALVWGTDVKPQQKVIKKQKIVIPMQSQCVVIDGTPDKRDQLYKYARENRPDYVILGYENVVNDWRAVQRLKPDLIVGDEITAIKSFGSERSQVFKEWDAEFRYGLTGTPIDNRPEELFSIMEWIDPNELGRPDIFDKTYITRDGYGRPKRYNNLDILHRKTKVFMARKTRFDADVAPHMPKDFHKEFYVSLTGKTKEMYSKIRDELVESLQEISGAGNFDIGSYYSGDGGSQGSAETGAAMAKFSALLMLCDHPQLLVESALKFDASFHSEANTTEGSKYAWQAYKDGDLDWITDKVKVPKFEMALEQILDLVEADDKTKVILFSFHKPILKYFHDALAKHSVESVVFNGDMNIGQKEAAKMRFKREPGVRVFLSSDAGGMGVDLPEANYLINYNHPWSSGKADQRNSRHIRAGSEWEEVWVLNYLVQGSVEEWKYNILDLKRRVGSAIIDGTKTNKGEIHFDVASLLEHLCE